MLGVAAQAAQPVDIVAMAPYGPIPWPGRGLALIWVQFPRALEKPEYAVFESMGIFTTTYTTTDGPPTALIFCGSPRLPLSDLASSMECDGGSFSV